MTPALAFAGVKKRFGRHEALRGIDLEVPRGSIFGLIGPNGAGKTTSFSIACGFLRADSGMVSILDAGPFDARRLKGRIGALPQDAALGRETRCFDHLVYFGMLQGLEVSAAQDDATRVLEQVGLADRADARTKTLSHGMLRRLAIAQALLGRPELVLLDEPTSGLDPRHAHEVRELLRSVAAQGRGATIVISSHNLPELETLCDHVAFIDHGVVVASDRTDTVTGRADEIEIALGDPPFARSPDAPFREPGPHVEALLKAALPGAEISWEAGERIARLRVAEVEHRAVEDAIGLALRALLDAGARIAGVRRGTSLETRFLEMT